MQICVIYCIYSNNVYVVYKNNRIIYIWVLYYKNVLVWIKMSCIGSDIWMLEISSWWNSLGWIRRYNLVMKMCCWAWALNFQSPHDCWLAPSQPLTCRQGWKLAVATPAPCLPACCLAFCHEGHDLWPSGTSSSQQTVSAICCLSHGCLNTAIKKVTMTIYNLILNIYYITYSHTWI